MAGFIVLEDGRAYAAANWACDWTVDLIAEHAEDPRLTEWLRGQRSSVLGLGMTQIDLRRFGSEARQDFRQAARAALAAARLTQDTDARLHSATQRLGDLVEMLARVDRGEPPQEFNPHMDDVLPPPSDLAPPF